MSKRLVVSNSNDDVDNLKTKKRFIITESDDDNEDDNPCYDVVEFNKTRRKLCLIGFDDTKATEITRSIYFPKLTDVAVSNTPSSSINVTVSSQSTAAERCYDVVEFNKTRRKLRLIGFDETKATEIKRDIYNFSKLTNISVSNTPSPAINVTVSSQSTAAERTVSFVKDASSAPAIAAAASAAYSAAVATATEESSEDDDIYSLPTLMGGECSGGADNTVKLIGKTDFSTSNSDRHQIYPNAEWLSCFVPQEHNSGVLTAYVLLFYTFLSGVSITYHVEGLNNVTHVNKLLLLKDFGTQFLGGFSTRIAESYFRPEFWVEIIHHGRFGQSCAQK
jgi:G:T/U-mismatch repair DNA glycosylase